MSDAPKTVYILQSDAEMLADVPEGRADSVIAGCTPLHNIHGETQTTRYIRADLYEELGAACAEARSEAITVREALRQYTTWGRFRWEKGKSALDVAVETCPGCKMAIYDEAAKAGWCTDCEPRGAKHHE